MIWPLDSEQSRNGSFRGVLRTVESSITECAEALWLGLPEPRNAHVEAVARHCGFTSTGQGVLRDLLHRMISEQAQYLHGIRASFGSYSDAKDQGTAMMIDNREMAAEYLAARRMEARLKLKEPQVTWDDLDEEWMHIEHLHP